MHEDLPGNLFKPVSDLFQTLRPDVVTLTSSTIETLELLIHHETNTIQSNNFKSTKHANVQQMLFEKCAKLKPNKYTMEFSTLGVNSDTIQFAFRKKYDHQYA